MLGHERTGGKESGVLIGKGEAIGRGEEELVRERGEGLRVSQVRTQGGKNTNPTQNLWSLWVAEGKGEKSGGDGSPVSGGYP